MSNQEDIKAFIELIKKETGVDFSKYSEKSFKRRIEKLEQDLGLNISDILLKLKLKKLNAKDIVEDITVNTTELFRDTAMWVSVFKELKKLRQNQDSINVLHLGVSSGEELYSTKILLNELGFSKINSVGIDLNSKIIQSAEKAIYKNNIIADYIDNYNKVCNELIDEHKFKPHTEYFKFNKKTDEIIVKNNIKSNVAFFVDDIISSDLSKYGTFDMVMCRNILIYFNMEIQNMILYKIYKILRQSGILVLGAHESIYAPLSSKFIEKGDIFIKS